MLTSARVWTSSIRALNGNGCPVWLNLSIASSSISGSTLRLTNEFPNTWSGVSSAGRPGGVRMFGSRSFSERQTNAPKTVRSKGLDGQLGLVAAVGGWYSRTLQRPGVRSSRLLTLIQVAIDRQPTQLADATGVVRIVDVCAAVGRVGEQARKGRPGLSCPVTTSCPRRGLSAALASGPALSRAACAKPYRYRYVGTALSSCVSGLGGRPGWLVSRVMRV
jgi:hypothetical protein